MVHYVEPTPYVRAREPSARERFALTFCCGTHAAKVNEPCSGMTLVCHRRRKEAKEAYDYLVANYQLTTGTGAWRGFTQAIAR